MMKKSAKSSLCFINEKFSIGVLSRDAFLFRFNKSKYEELKQKGFRLEF